MQNDFNDASSVKIPVEASTKVMYKKEGRKPINYTLNSRFTVRGEDGDPVTLKYIGYDGKETRLTIGRDFTFDLSNRIDQRNYKTLLAHLQADPTLRKVIRVYDENLEAERSLAETDIIVEMSYKLKTLKDSGNTEMLRNIYRRKYGTVGGYTDAIIYRQLMNLVQTEAKDISDLLKDINFDTKVLIDKAVEKGVLVKNGNFYSLADGKGVAQDEGQMVFYLEQNPDVKATLERMVSDAFRAAQASKPLTLKEVEEKKKEINPDVLAALEYAERIQLDSEVEEEISQEEILKAVKLAKKSEWNIDKVSDNTWTIKDRNGEFTAKGLDEYFIANPNEAKALIEELKANSIWR